MTLDALEDQMMRRRAEGQSPFRVGRYEIVTRIGGGGMATVYLARALGSLREGSDFERLAAVKVLHPHLAEDRGFVDMFLHEARVAANIRHPNVVTILDLGIEDGLLYNVMDYVEGDTLAAVQSTATNLGKGVPLPVALRVAVDVLSGLHAAHELRDDQGDLLNVVHRDVTPQNILIGIDGSARLTDFGIARARGRLVETTHGMLKGKLAYMPPEQLEASELDRRADVFAMGVTLWETLTLRRLYPSRTTFEQARKNSRAPYRPLREFRKGMPAVLDEICAHALADDADERFPTAAAFADALEQQLGPMLASSRDVGSFIAAVAREKLDREREVLRSTIRRTQTPHRPIDRRGSNARTPPNASPAAREKVPVSALEVSVLEPIPLVSQRKRDGVTRAPTMPSRGFFPNVPAPPEEHDESVTRELPPPVRKAPSVPASVSPSSRPHGLIEVIDDGEPRVSPSLEPVRWRPLTSPPAAPGQEQWKSPFALLGGAMVVFVFVLLLILAARS